MTGQTRNKSSPCTSTPPRAGHGRELDPIRFPIVSFCFANKAAAPVHIGKTVGFMAIAVAEQHAPLEYVGIVAGVLARGLGLRQFQQRAQFGE